LHCCNNVHEFNFLNPHGVLKQQGKKLRKKIDSVN
jgi:hypothetical protein